MIKTCACLFALFAARSAFAADPLPLSPQQKDALAPVISKYYQGDYSASEENSTIESILSTIKLTPIQIDQDSDKEFAAWVGYHAGNHNNSAILIMDSTDSGKSWRCIGTLLGSQTTVHDTIHEGYADLSTWWGLGSDQGEIRTYQMKKGFYEQVKKERSSYSAANE